MSYRATIKTCLGSQAIRETSGVSLASIGSWVHAGVCTGLHESAKFKKAGYNSPSAGWSSTYVLLTCILLYLVPLLLTLLDWPLRCLMLEPDLPAVAKPAWLTLPLSDAVSTLFHQQVTSLPFPLSHPICLSVACSSSWLYTTSGQAVQFIRRGPPSQSSWQLFLAAL